MVLVATYLANLAPQVHDMLPQIADRGHLFTRPPFEIRDASAMLTMSCLDDPSIVRRTWIAG